MSVNDLSLDHATHDELLVAALASGDRGELAPADAEAARRLVADCATCAGLHDDLRRLALATASLPAPRRERDFRLTEVDAARLRPRGWRRLLEPLAGPRFAFVQPLGGALAALGLAGLLVATVPSVLQAPSSGVSTVAPAPEAADQATAVASASGRAAAPALGVPSAGASAEGLAVPSSGASAPAGGQGPVGVPGSAAGVNPQPSTGAIVGPQAPVPSPSGRFEAPASGNGAPEAGTSGEAKASSAGPAATAVPAPVQAARGASAGEAAPGPEVVLAAGSLVLLLAGGGLFVAARSVRRRPAA